jgi:hypothetical protein
MHIAQGRVQQLYNNFWLGPSAATEENQWIYILSHSLPSCTHRVLLLLAGMGQVDSLKMLGAGVVGHRMIFKHE